MFTEQVCIWCDSNGVWCSSCACNRFYARNRSFRTIVIGNLCFHFWLNNGNSTEVHFVEIDLKFVMWRRMVHDTWARANISFVAKHSQVVFLANVFQLFVKTESMASDWKFLSFSTFFVPCDWLTFTNALRFTLCVRMQIVQLILLPIVFSRPNLTVSKKQRDKPAYHCHSTIDQQRSVYLLC